MATVIPPGYALATIILRLANDPEDMVITFGIELGGSFDAPTTMGNIRDAFTDTGSVGPISRISNAYTFAAVELAIGQDGGPPIRTELAVNVAGTDTAPPLPQNCAVLVRKLSALPGREGKGRMYVPGFAEGGVSPNGVIDSVNLTALQTRWDNFRAGVIVTDQVDNMVVLHSSPQAGGTPLPTPVTNLIVDNVIATQRRRLRR